MFEVIEIGASKENGFLDKKRPGQNEAVSCDRR
jgi:hypothetical protein